MDIHPHAAAMTSRAPSPSGGDSSTAISSSNGAAAAGVERRVDDGLHLRARLLKMIMTQEQTRKSSTDSPPR